MKVIKNNPFRPANRTLDNIPKVKLIYQLMQDKDDSITVKYQSSATLKSYTCQLRKLSIELHNGNRRFKLRDNGDEKTFTIYRVC